MGKSQREKGKRWEMEVARRHRRAMGFDEGDAVGYRVVCRKDQSNGGDFGADVDIAHKIWVECKVGARPNPLEAWRQVTTRSAGSGQLRLVAIKKDREEPVVMLSLSDWLDMFNHLWLHTTFFNSDWPEETDW